MRIARVLGTVICNRQLPELPPGRFLICEALDAAGVRQAEECVPRTSPMPESLIVFDQLGAGAGELIAVSEGREACMPFHPEKVPLDAYCSAILDRVSIDPEFAELPEAE